MKFSHKFLNTYCFILCIKKKKLKICKNWVVDMVADPLKRTGLCWRYDFNVPYFQWSAKITECHLRLLDEEGLVINAQKTNIVVFNQKSRQPANFRFYYDGNIINIVDSFKYLGCSYLIWGLNRCFRY